MNGGALPSYPKVFNLGHRAIQDLLLGPALVVQEKVDGSQFSCARIDGKYYARSKGVQINPDAPGMFDLAVANTIGRDLKDGRVYRFEYLRSPRHNTLNYVRVPQDNLVLFDITVGIQDYLDVGAAMIEAKRLGLEFVPTIAVYVTDDKGWFPPTYENFDEWITRDSFLGGQKVEGVIIKNYQRFCVDGHAMMGKHVREDFREKNHKAWAGKTTGSVLDRLVALYRSDVRWEKAIQHLRDQGILLGEPKDIGNLINEVKRDLMEECRAEIESLLFKEFQKDLLRGVVRGLPEWYKDKLVKQQFECGPSACVLKRDAEQPDADTDSTT